MNKPVATLILNRNLPEISDAMGDHLLKWDGDVTDIYVIESGSDPDKLSKYDKFWANWPGAIENGLRSGRGFNYGLLELEKIQRYDFCLMVCGDTSFFEEPVISILLEEMTKWPKLGIISPISTSPNSPESKLIPRNSTKFVWLVAHICWLFRSSFLDLIKTQNNPSYMDYFYDGENYRGYDIDTEVGIKAYINDYALAVTSKARIIEHEDLTDRNADVMRTERRAVHKKLMYAEGLAWMKKKYGFNNKWEMRDWAKQEYDEFFRRNPEYEQLRLIDPAVRPGLRRYVPKAARQIVRQIKEYSKYL